MSRLFGVGLPCDICCLDVESCICPECTVCGVAGDLLCYTPGAHGMVLTPEQRSAARQAAAEDRERAAWREKIEGEERYGMEEW